MDVLAFAFETPSSLAELLAVFNERWPGRFELRDSHYYGSYLANGLDPSGLGIRVYLFDQERVLEVFSETASLNLAVEAQQLLAMIDAHSIRETENVE